MTPTLIGRIQTRIALMLLVALPWTILVTPVLPRPSNVFGERAPLGDTYTVTLTAWLVILVLGCIVWEPLYHLGQQFRWEKDWPILFGLGTVVNEGILAWLIVRSSGPMDSIAPPADGVTFTVHLVTTWLLVWLMANGPIRIVLLRWRFRGGRVV
jgi:hypothetical protein